MPRLFRRLPDGAPDRTARRPAAPAATSDEVGPGAAWGIAVGSETRRGR